MRMQSLNLWRPFKWPCKPDTGVSNTADHLIQKWKERREHPLRLAFEIGHRNPMPPRRVHLWELCSFSLWTDLFPLVPKSVELICSTTPSGPSGLFDLDASHESFVGAWGVRTLFAHLRRAAQHFFILCWMKSFEILTQAMTSSCSTE